MKKGFAKRKATDSESYSAVCGPGFVYRQEGTNELSDHALKRSYYTSLMSFSSMPAYKNTPVSPPKKRSGEPPDLHQL